MNENYDDLEKLILDIENSDFHMIERKKELETFELWSDPILQANIAGNIGAYVVRFILNKLNSDEHRVLRWRLENKFRQYQVFNHYLPNYMAETIGLNQVLADINGVEKIRELCKQGFFLKSTLGDSSGRTNNFDRTAELDDIINAQQEKENHLEKWILQKRLNLIEEFRVHTFSRDVVYGLTCCIIGPNSSNNIDAEEFVKEILKKLPHAISEGTLIGWDIGITAGHEFYVIEANFTGYHTEFNPGFQTSGYFGDRDFGSIMCALLNNHFRSRYNISVDSVEKTLNLTNPFYEQIIFYVSLLTDEHIHTLSNRTKNSNSSAIIYLGDNEVLITKFLQYIKTVNLIKNLYLIDNN